MTAGDFITNELRPRMRDTSATPVFSASELLAHVSRGVRQIQSDAPHFRVQRNYELTGRLDTTLASGDEIPLPEMALNALCDYAMYLAYSADSDDKYDQSRAARALESYRLTIKGG